MNLNHHHQKKNRPEKSIYVLNISCTVNPFHGFLMPPQNNAHKQIKEHEVKEDAIYIGRLYQNITIKIL